MSDKPVHPHHEFPYILREQSKPRAPRPGSPRYTGRPERLSEKQSYPGGKIDRQSAYPCLFHTDSAPAIHTERPPRCQAHSLSSRRSKIRRREQRERRPLRPPQQRADTANVSSGFNYFSYNVSFFGRSCDCSSFWRLTLKIIPKAIIVKSIDEPPREISGRV